MSGEFSGMGYAVCPSCGVLFLGLEGDSFVHYCSDKRGRVESPILWATAVLLGLSLKSIELSRVRPPRVNGPP